MNRIVKQYEGKEIHVILDNLSTHKPKRDLWLARHPNVHFHYTPTHTWFNRSWSAQSLKAASFVSVAELITHIEASSQVTTRRPGRLSGPRASSTRNG